MSTLQGKTGEPLPVSCLPENPKFWHLNTCNSVCSLAEKILKILPVVLRAKVAGKDLDKGRPWPHEVGVHQAGPMHAHLRTCSYFIFEPDLVRSILLKDLTICLAENLPR